MRNHSKLILSALTAALILAAVVTTASASRLSISNRNFRVVWNPLQFSEAEGGTETRCPVTLEGTFHSNVIVKAAGALVGYVTRGIVAEGSCTNASTARILQASLPWHVRYRSFRGTLPRIERIRLELVGAAFLLNVFFGSAQCLYQSTSASPAAGELLVNTATGVVEGLAADNTVRIPLAVRLGGFVNCPATGIFNGTGTVTLLGNTTRITVRLI